MTLRRTLKLTHLESRLTPALATWDGGGANAFWTTPQNWVGDVVPSPGDDLLFPPGVAQRNSINTFAPATTFNLMTVTGSGYAIGGNHLDLTTGVFANIPAGGALTLALLISGTGGILTGGPGTVVLTTRNTFTGTVQVVNGVLDIRDGAALGANTSGSETIVGPNATLAVVGTQTPQNPNGVIAIPESIQFSGSGAIGGDGQPLGAIRGEVGEPVFSSPLFVTGGGAVMTASIQSQIFVTSLLDEAPGAPAGNLLLNGIVRFTNTATVAVTSMTQGAGLVFFDGQATNGSYSFSPTAAVPRVLEGSGTLGPLTVNAGGTLQPTNTITTGNLTFSTGGILQVGVFHDQFLNMDTASKAVVHGTVSIGNAAIAAGAGPALAAGTHFTIIDNDGTDPVVGQFSNAPEGSVAGIGPGYGLRITYHGGDGNDVDLIVDPTAALAFAVGAGQGGMPAVNVYAGDGSLIRSFMAFDPSFRGGVRVATGDFNLDGIPDIVTAAGPGGLPEIRVYDGRSAATANFPGFGFPNSGLIGTFLAYDAGFRGGVFVAAGDVNGDQLTDIVTGAGAGGGPHVRVFSGLSTNVIASYFAYDAAFTGGVSVAAGDVDGDGHAEVFTGAGAGGGPHVKVLNGLTGAVVTQFFAYESTFTGGVYVAAADVNGDHHAEVVTGTGVGGGPLVKLFNGQTGALSLSFFAYDQNFRGGVTVGGNYLDAVGHDEILTGAGPGGGPHVKSLTFSIPDRSLSFLAFDPAFTGGIYVG